MRKTTIGRLAFMCGCSLIATTGALAQDETLIEEAAAEPDRPAQAGTEGNVIVVTGSQIKGARIDDILPVTKVGENLIEAANPSSGDELFRAIPQAGSVSFNDYTTSGGINSARGDVASINLRELGTGNTLLLINGRRMVLNPGFQTELLVPVVSPDTNTIPVGGVDRVEVLRDGASPIYGADAVAGVVNTFLKGNLDGGFLEGTWRASDGTSLYSTSINGGIGFDFNEGRTNLTVYGYYYHENGAPTSIRRYSRDSDRRPLVEGTPWEGDVEWDASSTNSPFGQFDIQAPRSRTPIDDDDFHIQPGTFDGCRLDLGNGLCADNGTSLDRELRYNMDGDRDLFSKKDRYNVYGLLSHEFSPAAEFYAEASFYRSKSTRRNVQSALLGAVPIGIAADAYYNPFGPVTLADGSPNPNRVPGTTIDDEGAELLMERYRVIDAGPRVTTVTKDTYRLLAGLRGQVLGFDYDTAFLYSEAKATDLTRNRISTTALQNAINRTTSDAYNPFNGGCLDAPRSGDCTPNPQSVLDDIRIDVFRVGKTSLALGDLRLSKSDLLTLPGGDLGVAFGVEWRRETFSDDRDPHLDGTITFTDSVTGEFFGSDVLNSSPTPDTRGERDVYSAFAETLVPIVSPEMDVPLVHSLDVQLAGRFEHFSDVGSTVVPRAAASWRPIRDVLLRGAWSQGFRAPNLVQINDVGITRVNTQDDLVYCYAQIQKGLIENFGECSGSSTVSNRTGSEELDPEKTESLNFGIVLTPSFIPGLTLTADYWRVRQDGIVGVFGPDNAIALDLLRRLQGSSNPNVVRGEPDADLIDLYAGTGLTPAGDILSVRDAYLNLDSRVSKGWDFGLYYDIGETPLGRFNVSFNAARLTSFFQTPGPDGEELLDAVDRGILPPDITISDIGELLELNGRPKWRFTSAVNWRSGGWRVNLYADYIGNYFDDTALQDETNEPWPVDDWLTFNASVSYSIRNNTAISGTRIKFGVNNLFNKAPPLVEDSFGFDGAYHSARGRQFLIQVEKKF